MKPFSDHPFTNEFVEFFPGDPEQDNFPRPVLESIYSEVKPAPVTKPSLIAWSERLGHELGIDRPTSSDKDTLNLLAGNTLRVGMRPYANRYGGHQFGNWAGQLGDGRAISLGEVMTDAGRREFQLKGAGPTPYSRRGDGRAVLRSSVREMICSEAMHFLGVPTTRALSLVLTGDQVMRDFFYDGNPRAEPGAIVCRVSPSFLRFGNFEILASHGEIDLLRKLTDYTIRHFYPGLSHSEFLHEVSRKTAIMVAHWMCVGFVHGVMNTDNMSVLGLTIDYGPYGWLEPYEPKWTPNTTDAENKRYAFGNQPGIALWNVARFAEALSPLILDRSVLESALQTFRDTFGQTYTQMTAEKLGFAKAKSEDQSLVNELFRLLETSEADYVNFFRAISSWDGRADPSQAIQGTFYRKTLPGALREAWTLWITRYGSRLKEDGRENEVRFAQMKSINPKYVPRNYLAQNAIQAAEKGDYEPMHLLMKILEKPYDEQPEYEEFAILRPEWAKDSPGSSTLSCSS